MKKKTKSKKADAPMTRNEFKAAISKMTRNELIGLICDIYYANAHANAKDGCECDCGCGSESKSRPKRPKSRVSKKVK